MPVQTSTARTSARAPITSDQVFASEGKVFNDKAFELYHQVEEEIAGRDILLRAFYITYEAVSAWPVEETTGELTEVGAQNV